MATRRQCASLARAKICLWTHESGSDSDEDRPGPSHAAAGKISKKSATVGRWPLETDMSSIVAVDDYELGSSDSNSSDESASDEGEDEPEPAVSQRSLAPLPAAILTPEVMTKMPAVVQDRGGGGRGQGSSW